MKLKFIFALFILVLIPFTIYLTAIFPQNTWQYQCIDTMKVSRDDARILEHDKNAQRDIAHQMEIIKTLGANCVAIDTPYDEEFIPVLTMWVSAARNQHLHVWFRGNFSSWEGWFGYPKGMTINQLLLQTQTFVNNHSNLFADGDIFTPAPEAENGWPGNYVSPNDYPQFRRFLIEEYNTSQEAFTHINKHIDIWLSMSGGLARKILDVSTIKATGNKVTIDHYVHSPQEMIEYVDYFHNKFGATVIIGEFGAPIPDINGPMTDEEQATFVASVLQQLAKRKAYVYGFNYWVLAEGSTALLGKNYQEKPVTNVIKKYYKPSILSIL